MLEFPDMLPWDEMTAMVKRHEEQIARLETSVMALEKEKAALEKDASDAIAAIEQKAIRLFHHALFDHVDKAHESAQSDPTAMSYAWVDESGERHIQRVLEDLFEQALERLTPEQKKMLAEAQEDDCIF